MEDQIVIYQTADGQTQIDARLDNETVWLNAKQMSLLFDREESNIRRRISVGYCVKSKYGTAFRIWARKVLKDYLIKGYAVNERIRREQIGELRQQVGMIGRTIQSLRILVLLILAFPCLSNAQTSFDAREGCLNVIDFSRGQGIGRDGDHCVSANYTHEVFLSEQFCVGGGIGYHHRGRYDFSAVPVYLSAHYFFLDRRFSPFVNLHVGAFGMFGKKNVDTQQKYSISSKAPDFNLYVSPRIGMKIHVTPNIGVMASVCDDAYLLKTYNTAKADYRSRLLHSVAINVGMCFQIKGW